MTSEETQRVAYLCGCATAIHDCVSTLEKVKVYCILLILSW